MPPHEGSSLAQQIAEYIAKKIIQGEWVEGERIQELRIAQELNVSRGSVREALILLQHTDLIEIFPRRGAVVVEMSSMQVSALFETLSLLLGQIVAYISEDLTPLQKHCVLPLEAQLNHFCLTQDIEHFYDAIFLCLQDCLESARYRYLARFYQDLLPNLRRCYFLTLNMTKHELLQSEAQFKLVIAAILSQKPQQATLFMHDFCRHLQQLVLQSLTRMKQIELAWAKRSRR